MTVIVPDYNTIRVVANSTMDFPIEYADFDDSFILKGVDGLGPPEIDVNISGTPAQGGIFQSKVPRNKQIIMRIGLNPDYASSTTPRHLRNTLYGMLSGGVLGDDKVTVALITKNAAGAFVSEQCRIYGYVSKMEIVPFSKDPQVQVTIECLSPYFEEDALTSVSTAGVSLTTPAWENQGNAPAGFIFSFSIAEPISGNWKITAADGKYFHFDAAVGFTAGDVVTIDTRPGFRDAYVWTSGGKISLLGWITTDSDWLMLKPGMNSFPKTGQAMASITEIKYRKAWWGV